MGPTLTRSTAFSYNLGLSRDDDVEPLAVDELARLLCGVAAERAPGVAPVGVEAPLVLAALGLEHGTAPGRRDEHVTDAHFQSVFPENPAYLLLTYYLSGIAAIT